MKMDVYMPTVLLQPFVKCYRIIESQRELVNRVLPDTSLTMVFRYKGQINYLLDDDLSKLPMAVVSGLRISARLINYAACSAAVIVQFKEGGAGAFFKEPLHEFFEESISLDTFVSGAKISITEEQLAEARDDNQRIAIVERFLLSIIYKPKQDTLIANGMQRIYAAKGVVNVKELAAALCSSQDAFEKRFRKVIGISPKQFSSIIRMKSLINEKQGKQKLSDLAFAAGYFDQSHFNKDFKRFTGLSPTDFFRSSSFW